MSQPMRLRERKRKSTVVNNNNQIYKFKNLGSFGKFILIISIMKEICNTIHTEYLLY